MIENLGGVSFAFAFAYTGAQAQNPLTIQLPGDNDAEEGKIYKAGIDPTTVFLFDKTSEQRLR